MKQNLSKNWDFKAISLCVLTASAIWFFNALNKNYTTRVSYPVVFRTSQQQVVALTPPPNDLIIEVTGQGWSLFRKSFGIGVEPIVIDLINTMRVKRFDTKKFMPYFVNYLKDFKIHAIIPDTLLLEYDKVTTKKVQISLLPTQISLKEGYQITSQIKITPNQVVFKGANSILNQLSDTLSLQLEDQEIEENYEQTVPLTYFPQNQLLLKPEIEQVKVSFQVDYFVKRNQLIPNQFINFPTDSSVTISEKSIILHYWLKKEDENQQFADTIKSIIDFKKKDLADSTIVPVIYLPKEIKNSSFTPSKVKLKYAKNLKNRDNRRNRGG